MLRSTLLLFTLSLPCLAQSSPPPTDLRGVLLEQLRTTHNEKDWFVPANTAVAGLTAEQARWTDGKGNHSVGQLANHLIFWNARALARFNGKPEPDFKGNNDETFNAFDSKNWDETVKKLDQVMKDWEAAVSAADEKQLSANASLVAHIGAHNAYHIGQIIFVRKEQGSWDAANGVK